MKYLVISTYERNSSLNGIFINLEEAQKRMRELLEKHFNEQLEDSIHSYDEDFDWGITERSCWSSASDEEFDVNIVEVEEEKNFLVVSFKERVFSYHGCFEKEMEAYCHMEDLFEKYFEKDLQINLNDCFDSRDDEWGLEPEFAWSNFYGRNFDINIFQIKEID